MTAKRVTEGGHYVMLTSHRYLSDAGRRSPDGHANVRGEIAHSVADIVSYAPSADQIGPEQRCILGNTAELTEQSTAALGHAESAALVLVHVAAELGDGLLVIVRQGLEQALSILP